MPIGNTTRNRFGHSTEHFVRAGHKSQPLLPWLHEFASRRSTAFCRTTRGRGPEKPWSRKTETKPNFYWLHSWWWWFRAQTSALQQATAFLGTTNRDATTIPPVPIRRNTSTLNDTFTGDRRFTSSFVSADARRRRILREPATANGPTVPPRQYSRHCS